VVKQIVESKTSDKDQSTIHTDLQESSDPLKHKLSPIVRNDYKRPESFRLRKPQGEKEQSFTRSSGKKYSSTKRELSKSMVVRDISQIGNIKHESPNSDESPVTIDVSNAQLK